MAEEYIDPINEVYTITRMHPTFHNLFASSWEQIFRHHGALVMSDRHYIALMAASRHRCFLLMDYHRDQFIAYGGDHEWLDGLSSADPRLRSLDEMNRYIAHQPWLLTAGLINKLVGRGSPAPLTQFTLSELTLAAIILAQTHVLCSFVCGVGLERTVLDTAELDFLKCDDEEYQETRNNKENSENEETVGEVEKLVRRMLDLETSQSAQANFASIDGEQPNGGDSPASTSTDEEEGLRMYTENPLFAYVDFQSRTDKSIKTFRICEFSWDHCFNLISDLSGDLYSTATCLDQKFDHIQRLTYKFMGSYESIDTTKYRAAVWNYIQGLYGIRYDDYDYSKVNVLLDKSTKTFIKNMSCFPHKLTSAFSNVMTGFKTSEKVHVCIMVMEARLQAMILHFSRALCNYNSMTMARKGGNLRPLD